MGDKKPSGLGGGGAFEVSGQTTASSKPGKGAFDDPASRQKLEAFDPSRALNDLDGPRPAMGERVDELFSAINAVCEDMSKLGKAIAHPLQQRDRTMDVLDVGGMDVDGKQETISIGDDVPLASVNPFAGIETARAAGLCRRSTLAVDDGRRWCRLATEFSPGLPDQSPDDPLPSASVAPSVKISLDRRIWWELAWQCPPLAAGGQNVEDRLNDLPQINLPWSPEPPSSRHLPGNQRPLRICQIACVTQSTTLILPTSDFGPRHRVLPRIFANPKESQSTKITHCFFGQALRMRSDQAATQDPHGEEAQSAVSNHETAILISIQNPLGLGAVERERGHVDLELLAACAHHLVAPGHDARCGRERNARGIFKAFARRERRLLADHALATHFLLPAGGIRDDPVPRAQLHGFTAGIGDHDGVGPEILPIFHGGTVREEIRLDGHFDVTGHGAVHAVSTISQVTFHPTRSFRQNQSRARQERMSNPEPHWKPQFPGSDIRRPARREIIRMSEGRHQCDPSRFHHSWGLTRGFRTARRTVLSLLVSRF